MSQQSSDSGLRIYLLGRFEVRAGEQLMLDHAWSRRKAKALLKLLTLQRNRSLHREQVLDALWPDGEPDAAVRSLYKSLYHLRAALGARGVTAPVMTLTADTVALSPDLWVDVDQFRHQAQVARVARNDPTLYEQALALYVGDLLPEDIYEDWAEAPREELRTLRLHLLLEVSQLYEGRGQVELAAERLQQLLQADPLHEEAHRALMRLYAQAGSRHRALRQYQACREVLARELEVEPAHETEELYREIVAGRLGDVTPVARPVSVARPIRRGPLAPLYGRERELQQVEDVLDAALGGHGQALFVAGMAGIGKTRFAQQIVATAEDAGALVLTGRGYEFEASVAYQPVRDMLQQAVEQNDDEPAIRVVQRSFYLKRLLPDGDSEPPPASDPTLLQLELFNEIGRLFGTLATPRQPLVLFFDDLHAADEASLRLIHFLCRQLLRHPILLVGNYRPEEASHDHPIAALLSSLRREGLAHEIHLDPLPERAMYLLIEPLFGGQPVERALVREIVDHAEGNPLFVAELVHTLREEGRARLVEGRWQRSGVGSAVVPGAIQDLLDRRLRRLGEAAYQVLQSAAALGREFDYGLLRSTLVLSEAEVLDGLDECIARYFIEETATGYRFRHDLLREGIYGRLTRARRQQLHRIAGLALAERQEARGTAIPFGGPSMAPDPEVVGYHFAQSDEPWRAVPYLMAAARRAASVFANEQAIGLYEQALDVLRTQATSAEPQQLAPLLEELGDVVKRTGDVSRSIPHYEEVAALFVSMDDSEAASRARGKAALAHIICGNVRAATELIEAIVQVETKHLEAMLQAMTAEWPKYVVSRLLYLLAQLRWHSGQHRDALEAAEKALLAAESSGDILQQAQAYEVLALACHSLGDWQKGVEYELNRGALGVPGFDTDVALDAHL